MQLRYQGHNYPWFAPQIGSGIRVNPGSGGPISAGDVEFRCSDIQLFAGLIKIMYAMRNALLHGELQENLLRPVPVDRAGPSLPARVVRLRQPTPDLGERMRMIVNVNVISWEAVRRDVIDMGMSASIRRSCPKIPAARRPEPERRTAL
jgi:hypothetical protein